MRRGAACGHIVAAMRSHLNRRTRRRATRYGIPRVLYGLGLGMSMIFLLWAMAMVFIQAWEALQTRFK